MSRRVADRPAPARAPAVRVLGTPDRAVVDRLLARDPVRNCLVASRVESAGLDPSRLGGQLWGWGVEEAQALCLAGANLVPLSADPAAVDAFARQAAAGPRRCSSIVGPAEAVLPIWHAVGPSWGTPREVRPEQPLLRLDREPLVGADPGVRVQPLEALDELYPACVAMFTEEVGVSPVAHDGGRAYRARLRELLNGGRCFARIEDGEVIFKAELGAMSTAACQIQGVWVAPDRRGQGLAAAGVAAVVRAALTRVPVVSLYVNEYNAAALRAYRRVGFTRVGTFATVLF